MNVINMDAVLRVKTTQGTASEEIAFAIGESALGHRTGRAQRGRHLCNSHRVCTRGAGERSCGAVHGEQARAE